MNDQSCLNMTSSEEIIQFCNCDILRDHKIFREDLWVRDRKIINPEPIFFDEKVVADIKIDCGGMLIAPGFIDLQINGGFGLDFSTNLTDVENGVMTVAKGVLKYGVTSFCPTIITSSPKVYHQIIPNIKKQNGSKEGAGVLGIHVEGPFINKEKKGAHPVQYIRTLDYGFQDILDVYGSIENVTLLTLAPELDPEGLVIQELVKCGITVSLGHSTGSLTEGERAINQGSSFITHLFNAMLPFHHRDPGLVGLLTSQKLPQDKTVFYGIIADGIHTHPAALRIAYRSNSKGLVLVTDAMSAMGLEPGNYCIGEQQVQVTGKKAVVAGTNILSGSIATMDVCVRYLSESTGCTVVGALESAALHPAQVLNITESKGTLNFGTDADFVFLDKNLNVTKTYIAGECVWDKSWNIEQKYCA